MEKESFTYHKVSEKEKGQIKRESKKLLDEFASKLEKIKTPGEHFSSSTNPSGMREEGNGWQTDSDFHEITFANTPFIDDNFIVAEKGKWK